MVLFIITEKGHCGVVINRGRHVLDLSGLRFISGASEAWSVNQIKRSVVYLWAAQLYQQIWNKVLKKKFLKVSIVTLQVILNLGCTSKWSARWFQMIDSQASLGLFDSESLMISPSIGVFCSYLMILMCGQLGNFYGFVNKEQAS